MVSMSYVAWMADFMMSYGITRESLLKGTGLENQDFSDAGGERFGCAAHLSAAQRPATEPRSGPGLSSGKSSADRLFALEECAAQLGISSRTLRRRLQERGLSYQDIADSVRADFARSYLESSRLSIECIAERLGCSEPTSFSRAFRRWTGMSPREFRKLDVRPPWPALFDKA